MPLLLGLSMSQSKIPSIALRLPHSLKTKAAGVVQAEGLSLNHFITLAIAEKVNRLYCEIAAQAEMRPNKTQGLREWPLKTHKKEEE